MGEMSDFPVMEYQDPEAPEGRTALELLQEVYRNKLAPLSVRMRAATIAIQYETPKLAVTGYLRDDAGFAAALDRALARSNAVGKVIELKANEDDRP
jgi:hypothetical protein